jgi:uncharacterized protein YbbC (DUF1343 family)
MFSNLYKYVGILGLVWACQKNTTQSFVTENKKNISPDSLQKKPEKTTQTRTMMLGIEQTQNYLPLLQNKHVALVVNHSSIMIQNNKAIHLVDTLLAQKIKIKKVFAPEHGFRGDADAGETVKNDIDIKTGLPIVSLYGKNKKPTPEQLADIDVVVFDIQDVGVRFFTYISTMHYVMEACAENNKLCIILDRPNPNGDYVDGCVLQKGFESFIGMHPIPVVHGLTVGELALMINGEGWLKDGKKCRLEVIKMQHYTHKTPYILPIKPSPNLPNQQSIRLYPSLCFFEGTPLSVGRGTDFPFQVIGYPNPKMGSFSFTPVSKKGMAKNPLFENQVCYGIDLRNIDPPPFTLSYLIDFYKKYPEKDKYFSQFFDKLAGNSQLKEQIKQGMSEKQIRETWKKGLEEYQTLRKKYLLYDDE